VSTDSDQFGPAATTGTALHHYVQMCREMLAAPSTDPDASVRYWTAALDSARRCLALLRGAETAPETSSPSHLTTAAAELLDDAFAAVYAARGYGEEETQRRSRARVRRHQIVTAIAVQTGRSVDSLFDEFEQRLVDRLS
jgi:hypothetical protein